MQEVKLSDDERKRINAMYQLECIEGDTPIDDIWTRINAAHYIVQSMFGGFQPENYDEVMRQADLLDQKIDALHPANLKD